MSGEWREQSKTVLGFASAMNIKLDDKHYLLLKFRISFNRSFINGNKVHRLHNLERKMKATDPRGKCFKRMREKGVI